MTPQHRRDTRPVRRAGGPACLPLLQASSAQQLPREQLSAHAWPPEWATPSRAGVQASGRPRGDRLCPTFLPTVTEDLTEGTIWGTTGGGARTTTAPGKGGALHSRGRLVSICVKTASFTQPVGQKLCVWPRDTAAEVLELCFKTDLVPSRGAHLTDRRRPLLCLSPRLHSLEQQQGKAARAAFAEPDPVSAGRRVRGRGALVVVRDAQAS